MRGMDHIPVIRKAGAGSFDAAIAALKAGGGRRLPRSHHQPQFVVKELETGAARMALETGAPLIPVAIWGTQRIWTRAVPGISPSAASPSASWWASRS